MSSHTISLYVENHSGALSRIAGLFSSRGYNIISITAGPTNDVSVSHVTIVVDGDDKVLEQIVKQLNRLIDVIKVKDFKNRPVIDRELALITTRTTKGNRAEILNLVTTCNGKIASASASSVVVELCADSAAVDNMVTLLRPYGIQELIRSGRIALACPKN